jgi:hypothetical protein
MLVTGAIIKYYDWVRYSFKEVTMAQVAFFTFGFLHEPVGHPKTREYRDQAPVIWEAAEATPGFISRPLSLNNTLDHGPWGIYVAPRWYSGGI